MQIPTVTKEEAKKFSSVWNCNGVAIIIDDVHCKFAADFANVILRSFIEQYMRQQIEASKPKVQIVEE